MGRYKWFLSCLLLLIYTIGFAHDPVSHCHHGVTASVCPTATAEPHHCNHHLHHHQHNDTDPVKKEHDHTLHADHFLNLMLCILSELEHAANHCLFLPVAPAPVHKTAIKRCYNPAVAALLAAPFSTAPTHGAPFVSSPELFFSDPPLLEQAPYRGPPPYT